MNRTGMAKFTVPDELRELLLDFTISYLLEQPSDIVEYAVDFFTKLRDNRMYNKTVTQSSDESMGSGDDEEFEPPPVLPTRRKSVFAETYNPEDDDEDDTQKVVHPKSDDQRKRLAETVKNILLFRSLEAEQMQEVLDAMFERRVTSGEYVIMQGDDGDNFYVIESGTYSIWVSTDNDKTPRKVGAYEGSGSFGELALMYNMPRAASIQAESEGLLWAMDRQTFRRIVLKSAFRKRKMYESLIDNVPMLKALEAYERMNLADALVPRSFHDGEEIIRQGLAADGMYFVENGTVRISIVGDNGVEAEVSRVTKGQYFGELALVTHRPRAASAFAVGDVKLAFLDVEAFERLLGPCMEIMKRNIDDYEGQLERIFGTKISINEMR